MTASDRVDAGGGLAAFDARRLSALVAQCPYLDHDPTQVWLILDETGGWTAEHPVGPAATLAEVRAELDRLRREAEAATEEPAFDLPRFRPVDR